MKLDTRDLRYLAPEDWRVLTAVELASKTHSLVPTPLIVSLSHIRSGNPTSQVQRSISVLAKANLISRVKNAKYDGYRLTYGGMDYLALHGLIQKGYIEGLGNRVAVGKESDIYTVLGPPPAGESPQDVAPSEPSPSTSGMKSKSNQSHKSHRPPKKYHSKPYPPNHSTPQKAPPSSTSPPTQLILKIHRLGRTSFRTAKLNRSYLPSPSASIQSWLHISRLSAQKEYLFQSALHSAGFPVPYPIAHNRHMVLMEYIDAPRLQQVKYLGASKSVAAEDEKETTQSPLEGEEQTNNADNVPKRGSDINTIHTLYSSLMTLIIRLASLGVIHGDFNEFNILIKEEEDHHHQDEPSNLSNPNPTTTTPPKIHPILIDFPQLLSTSHPNAPTYFLRDVNCIKRFFSRKFGYTSTSPGPFFKDALKELAKCEKEDRLDLEIEAAGFSRKMGRELEAWMMEREREGEGEGEGEEGGEGDMEEEEEQEDDDDEVNGESAESSGAESDLDEEKAVVRSSGEEDTEERSDDRTPSGFEESHIQEPEKDHQPADNDEVDFNGISTPAMKQLTVEAVNG